MYNDFNLVDKNIENVVAYARTSDNEKKLLVVCYFSPKFVQWGRAADFLKREVKEIVLSNAGKKSDSFGDASIHLEPYKAFVVRL